MKRSAVILLFLVSTWLFLPTRSGKAADVHVNFNNHVGSVHLAYGTNEFRDLIEDGDAQRRSREANTQYIRMWIDMWFNPAFAPSRDVRHWFYLENFVQDTLRSGKNRGAIPMICFATSPAWMNDTGRWDGTSHPRDFNDFANYILEIMKFIRDTMMVDTTGWLVEIWWKYGMNPITGKYQARGRGESTSSFTIPLPKN